MMTKVEIQRVETALGCLGAHQIGDAQKILMDLLQIDTWDVVVKKQRRHKMIEEEIRVILDKREMQCGCSECRGHKEEEISALKALLEREKLGPDDLIDTVVSKMRLLPRLLRVQEGVEQALRELQIRKAPVDVLADLIAVVESETEGLEVADDDGEQGVVEGGPAPAGPQRRKPAEHRVLLKGTEDELLRINSIHGLRRLCVCVEFAKWQIQGGGSPLKVLSQLIEVVQSEIERLE